MATTGDGGGGLLLELHCACAAVGAMTCANVMVPSASRIFEPKRGLGRYAGTVMVTGCPARGSNTVSVMVMDLLDRNSLQLAF